MNGPQTGVCDTGRYPASDTEERTQLRIESLSTPRLLLTPLAVADAEAMVAVLADPALYQYTGGEPPTLEALRDRYERQVAGAPADSAATWLNWIVRFDDEPVGYVQATVQGEPGAHLAELAWVIGTAWQGRGFASEAALRMTEWLATQGVTRWVASIHPDHRASERVAERLGLAQLGDAAVDTGRVGAGDGAGGAGRDRERVWDTIAAKARPTTPAS